MKPLGVKTSNKKPGEGYTQKQPFTNPTSYQVGQRKILNGKPVVISAITRNTSKTYSIYAVDATSPYKLDVFLDCQTRREKGQIDVYLAGKEILVVTVQ